MPQSLIRAQIKIILEAVTGIGRVYDYLRWATDWTTILSLFKPAGQDKINAWMITRKATGERWGTIARLEDVHSFMIIGVYSHDDQSASEKTFQDLIDAIQAKFRDYEDLNGTCLTTAPQSGDYSDKAGIQVLTVEIRMFGGVLCHYCELGLGVEEEI